MDKGCKSLHKNIKMCHSISKLFGTSTTFVKAQSKGLEMGGYQEHNLGFFWRAKPLHENAKTAIFF
jgi:hypothetical protein